MYLVVDTEASRSTQTYTHQHLAILCSVLTAPGCLSCLSSANLLIEHSLIAVPDFDFFICGVSNEVTGKSTRQHQCHINRKTWEARNARHIIAWQKRGSLVKKPFVVNFLILKIASFPMDNFHYKSVGHLTNKPTLCYIKNNGG